MFAALGGVIYRHRAVIVVVSLALLPLAAYVGRTTSSLMETSGYENPGAESFQVERILKDDLGVGRADLIAIYTVTEGTVEDAPRRDALLAAVDRAAQDPSVLGTMTTFHGSDLLLSEDARTTFVVVSLRGDDQDRFDALPRLESLLAVDGMAVEFSGHTKIGAAARALIRRDIDLAEYVALPITAILLVFIYGSVVSASLPVVLGLMTIVISYAALRGILLFMDVNAYAGNLVTILGLGLAIDYSLFMVNRFREELKSHGVEGAVIQTVATTGRTVVFAGMTVAVSLLGLLVLPTTLFRSMAIGGSVVACGAALLSITFLPALLAILGPRVDTLRVPGLTPSGNEPVTGSFWYRIAHLAMGRPVIVSIGVAVSLALLAVPFARFDPSIPDHRILPAGHPARVASERLDNEFLPHLSTPIQIVVQVNGDALSEDHVPQLHHLHEAIEQTPGITRVNGLFAAPPLVRQHLLRVIRDPARELNPEARQLLERYVRGSTMRFEAYSEAAFNTEVAATQVRQLRALDAPDGAAIQVGGMAAVLLDLRARLWQRTPWMLSLVAAATFVVLFWLFGSITLPLKAILMNTLALSASFGAIVWVFQDGRFADLLHYSPIGITDISQPFLMFAIVFGLSMDYEVLILSRIQEEYTRSQDHRQCIALGLARTGRLITGAAAVIVIVIGAMATSEIVFLKTLGVGLALAIVIDATIVRALLVPALMLLMGKWNWYCPRFLRFFHR